MAMSADSVDIVAKKTTLAPQDDGKNICCFGKGISIPVSSLKDASHDCLLVAVKGGKVVQGREEDDNIIFKPDCPGHYDLYCKDIFTSSYTVGYPDVKLDITGVTDKGKTPIDSALSFVKYHLVPDDETKPLVKGKIEEGSMSYTPQHPGLHYLYLYDDSGCSLYDRGLSVYVISEKLEQTIIRTAYRKLSRDEREKQLQPWDGGKAKQYTYVLVDTKAAPDNIEDNEENFIRFVKAIFYVGKGTIRLKPTSQKAATPTSQRALDHVRDADKNNLSERVPRHINDIWWCNGRVCPVMFDGVDDKKKAADIREASMIRLIGVKNLYNVNQPKADKEQPGAQKEADKAQKEADKARGNAEKAQNEVDKAKRKQTKDKRVQKAENARQKAEKAKKKADEAQKKAEKEAVKCLYRAYLTYTTTKPKAYGANELPRDPEKQE